MCDDFLKIVKYNQWAHRIMDYNTIDFSIYLYGFIKMVKPFYILELGTGLGCTSFLAALACKENDYGKVITVDNSSQFCSEKSQSKYEYFNEHWANYCLENNITHKDFLKKKAKEFEIDNFIELKNFSLDDHTYPEFFNNLNISNIGIVFNDIHSDPLYTNMLLLWMLPLIEKEAYLITDGLYSYSNFLNFYDATEKILRSLNQGKISKHFSYMTNDEGLKNLHFLLSKFSFSSMYFKKQGRKNNNQDNFSIIKIYQTD